MDQVDNIPSHHCCHPGLFCFFFSCICWIPFSTVSTKTLFDILVGSPPSLVRSTSKDFLLDWTSLNAPPDLNPKVFCLAPTVVDGSVDLIFDAIHGWVNKYMIMILYREDKPQNVNKLQVICTYSSNMRRLSIHSNNITVVYALIRKGNSQNQE